MNNPPAALRTAALAAVRAIGLDFGAVDCATSHDGGAFIIEVNTGPGLQGVALERYTAAFAAWFRELERPARAPRAAAAEQAPARRAASRAVGAAPADEDAGLARLMRNVRTDEEARAVIDELMARRRG